MLYSLFNFYWLTAIVLQLSVLQKHHGRPLIVLEVSADDKAGLKKKPDVQPLRIALIQKKLVQILCLTN